MNIQIKPIKPKQSVSPTLLNRSGLKHLITLLSLCWLGVGMVNAQDIHYTQFYNAPMTINPALTGVFGGDVRFMGNYRGQWANTPVDYRTFTAVADMKFINRTAKKGFFSGGLSFNYDQAGYSKLNLTNLGLSGSYTHQLSNNFFASLGAMASANQRRFQLDDLTFDTGFDTGSGTYDPTLGSGESFGSTNKFFLDFAAGINFRLQGLDAAEVIDRLEKRSKLDFGVGFFHVTEPDQSFYDNYKTPLTMRFAPYVLGVVQLGRNLDAVGNLVGQFQAPYKEFIGMIGARVHLSRRLGRQLAVQLGVAYRFNEIDEFTASRDAWMPNIEVHYRQWRAGFSYDVNISDFNVTTNRRGGPEFSIRYILRKVRPLPYFKHCPLI